MKNKILTALLSLAIAVGLWLYVVTVVSPNSEKTYYNIPVTLRNESILEERGLMVTTPELPTVNLRLAGNRIDLDKLNSSNISVVADVSGIYSAGENTVGYTVSYPGDVPSNAISVQKRTPDNIVLTVEERASKTVKVEVEYVGTLPDGFSVDKENVTLDTREFQIAGPKQIIKRVTAARITVDLTDRKDGINNLQIPYVLVDKSGSPVDSELVEDKLEVPGVITVQMLRIVSVKQVTLVADIVSGGGATDKTSQITITPASIFVSGSENLLKAMGDTLSIGTVYLGELAEDTELKFVLPLPEGVSCESGETEATVQVRFPELITKTVRVTDIASTNVPRDMYAKINTKVLDVQIRGPKAIVDKIESKNVKAMVDFTNTQTGTETKQVTVTLGEEFAEAGAVGTYTVSATVSQR